MFAASQSCLSCSNSQVFFLLNTSATNKPVNCTGCYDGAEYNHNGYSNFETGLGGKVHKR